MLKRISYGLTDQGCVRDNNQDSFLIHEAQGLYVVADGMGGHAGGEIASSLAVRTINEVYTAQEDPEATVADFGALYPNAIQQSEQQLIFEKLRYAINRASQAIQSDAVRRPAMRGMGTTVVLLAIEGTMAYVAHAGDSRGYLIRPDGIRRMTRDHTWVADQIRAGLITEEQGASSQFRNLLTRTVGMENRVNSDTTARFIEFGDRYLLCSDGLHGVVTDAEIFRIVLNHSPRVAVEKLIQLARERGGPDNITCLVVAFEEEDLRRRRRQIPFEPEI